MGYEAKILADSIASGVRLTTLEVTFPRIVLAEFNTHRVFSRNSASSRAIPVEKRIAAVQADPFIPAAFAANKKGMQAGEVLRDASQDACRETWLAACGDALCAAAKLAEYGVHKHWANRLIEPFSWHTVIVTATEWENFFALRCNPMAAPEIRTAAEMMRDAMAASTPRELQPGAWHLPLIQPDELLQEGQLPSDEGCTALPDRVLVKLSVARCARVSYLTHDGKRDVDADLALYDRLLTSGHMSPFEHAAQVGEHLDESVKYGDFIGNFAAPWVQHRKQLHGEAVFKATEKV